MRCKEAWSRRLGPGNGYLVGVCLAEESRAAESTAAMSSGVARIHIYLHQTRPDHTPHKAVDKQGLAGGLPLVVRDRDCARPRREADTAGCALVGTQHLRAAVRPVLVLYVMYLGSSR